MGQIDTWHFKKELNPLNNQNGLKCYLDTFSNASTYTQIFNVKSYHTPDKTWWKQNKAAQQNQINLGKEYCIPLNGKVNWLLFILFPGQFELLAQALISTKRDRRLQKYRILKIEDF